MCPCPGCLRPRTPWPLRPFAVSGALFMSRRWGRVMFTARGVSLAAAALGVLSAFAAYGMSLVLA